MQKMYQYGYVRCIGEAVGVGVGRGGWCVCVCVCVCVCEWVSEWVCLYSCLESSFGDLAFNSHSPNSILIHPTQIYMYMYTPKSSPLSLSNYPAQVNILFGVVW